MANPDNSHHVHSDGYRSDKGDPDQMRLLEDVADEIEQIDGVFGAYPDEDLDGPYVEVDYDGDESTAQDVRWECDGWSCSVTRVTDNWIQVRV